MELNYKKSKRKWRMILNLYLHSSRIITIYIIQFILFIVIVLSVIYSNYISVLGYSYLFIFMTALGYGSEYFNNRKRIRKDYDKIVFTPDAFYIDDVKLQYSEIGCSIDKNNEVLIEVNGLLLIAKLVSKSHNYLRIAHFMAYSIVKTELDSVNK